MLIRPNGDPKGKWREYWFKLGDLKFDIPPEALNGKFAGEGLYIARALEKLGAPIKVVSGGLYGHDREWAEIYGYLKRENVERRLSDGTKEYWMRYSWVDQG